MGPLRFVNPLLPSAPLNSRYDFKSGTHLKGVTADVLVIPQTMQELQIIAKQLLLNDAELLKLADAEDEKIAVTREGETTYWMRSTIITLAIHHATEHRAQAVSALEAKGFKVVNLDDYDLWGYELANN